MKAVERAYYNLEFHVTNGDELEKMSARTKQPYEQRRYYCSIGLRARLMRVGDTSVEIPLKRRTKGIKTPYKGG